MLIEIYDQDYEISGTPLGQLSGTTPITITGYNSNAGYMILAVDSTGGVTGTVTVTFKPPGIAAAQSAAGNSLTVEDNSPIYLTAEMTFEEVILTPNISGADADWRLEHHGG